MNPGAAFLAACLAFPLGLAAEPLEKEACERLQSEKQALIVLGVDKEYAKGPDWAKANLAQAELNLLKQYVTLDEQLKFRCGLAMVTLQLPDELEDGLGDDVIAGPATPPMPARKDQAVLKPAGVAPAGGAVVAPKPAAVNPARGAVMEPKPAAMTPAGSAAPRPAAPAGGAAVAPKPAAVAPAGAAAIAPKPATPPAKPQPATLAKPDAPAAPAKPPVKPAPPKPQSSWNTQTAPLESVAPPAIELAPVKPKPERVRRIESGDQG